MRVLLISKACLVGAYQTKLEQIARFEDIDLTVLVPPVWEDPAGDVPLEPVHTEGYRLLVEPIRFNGHYHLHYYPQLGERMEALQPDIVHIDEEPYNVATWHALRQARAVGARSLFFSWQNIRRSYPFPFNVLEKQVLNRVSFAIVGNQAAAAVWRAKGYEGPCRVIPQFGVDPTHFHPPLEVSRAPSPVLRIGSAGRRLVWEKGNDLLLRAVAGLPGAWEVHIAGEGPERAALAQLARELGIAERVSFDGVIPSTAMPDYLRGLDVLVLPSRTLPNWKEQFGRVLIEAMACEVAVVGSDSGEIPHVVAEAGLIFPEESVDALRAALLRLMESNMLRERLGRAGRRRVLAQYTQDRIAAQTVDVYREMVRLPAAGRKHGELKG